MTSDRLAVAAYFGVLGLVCTAWASSLDDLKALLGLSAAEQGWLLMCGPIGNLISFTFASSLLARVGSRRGVLGAGVLYLFSATALACCFRFTAPIPCWCAAIACFGASGNVYNIAVNTQGGLVERRMERTIMNSFHAVFSLACLIGGCAALTWTALEGTVFSRFLVMIVLGAWVHLAVFRDLPDDEPSRATIKKQWHRPDRALVGLGLAGLVIMGCEGAVSDWVGVFYREALGVNAAYVKLGFCAVTGLMALGRFLTDGLIDRFGAKRVFHAYCVFVSAGLAIAMSSPYFGLSTMFLLIVATIGFAITGLGISGLVPILYSKANRTTSMPASSAITFVGSMGFLGYFAGPPVIGQIAQATNYSIALGLFSLLILACLIIDVDVSPDRVEMR